MRFDFEGTSLDMIREMVIMGLGITFMPGLYARSELFRDPNVKLFELKDRSLSRTIGMVWRKSSLRSSVYHDLADVFRQSIADKFEGVTPEGVTAKERA